MPADADREELPDVNVRAGRRSRTLLVVCAVVVTAALGAWLCRDRIFGTDQHADQVNAARQIEAPAGPLDHQAGPAQPSTSTPIRTLPGASVTSISTQLPQRLQVPEGLQADSAPGGYVYAGNFTDQKIDAVVRVLMAVAAPGRQDQITNVDCLFQRSGITADAAVLGEVKGCLAAVLPARDLATASAWLDADASTLAALRPHEARHTEIGPARVRINRTPDMIDLGMDALQPSPAPSGGR